MGSQKIQCSLGKATASMEARTFPQAVQLIFSEEGCEEAAFADKEEASNLTVQCPQPHQGHTTHLHYFP